MSLKASEYTAHAEEAERLAQASQGADERTAYERMAAVWRELAAAAAETDEPVRAESTSEAMLRRATAKSQ